MEALKETIEERVIAQLRGYKTIVGRMKVLEKYPIGNGLYLTEPFDEDDKLQPLHRQLSKMPSHMYLTNREQKLEEVANAYITNHPAGVDSQYWAVNRIKPLDDEDRKLLKELADKIGRVVGARKDGTSALEQVLERVSELQDLQYQKRFIDDVLIILADSNPKYSELLKEAYIEDKANEVVASSLHISLRTYDRWRLRAIQEYAQLAGIR